MDNVFVKVLSVFLVLLVFTPHVHSVDEGGQTLPDYYPEWLPNRGKLQEVDLKAHKLLINATTYEVDPNVRVHSLNTEHSSVHILKPGLKIAYEFRPDANNVESKVIAEIWVLPSDAIVAL